MCVCVEIKMKSSLSSCGLVVKAENLWTPLPPRRGDYFSCAIKSVAQKEVMEYSNQPNMCCNPANRTVYLKDGWLIP